MVMPLPALASASFAGLARGIVYNRALPSGLTVKSMGLANWSTLPLSAEAVLYTDFNLATGGFIDYRLSVSDVGWQHIFSVQLSRRPDGINYDVYREETLLEGYFSVHHWRKAVVSYEDDGAWVDIGFMRTDRQDEQEGRWLMIETIVKNDKGKTLFEILARMRLPDDTLPSESRLFWEDLLPTDGL